MLRLVVDYNAFDHHTIVESDIEIPPGDSTLVARFRREAGSTGSVSLHIDGTFAGEARRVLGLVPRPALQQALARRSCGRLHLEP